VIKSKVEGFDLNILVTHIKFYNNYSCAHKNFCQQKLLRLIRECSLSLYINYLTFRQRNGEVHLTNTFLQTKHQHQHSPFITQKVIFILHQHWDGQDRAKGSCIGLSNAGIMFGLEINVSIT
jgi:hypothetical protein